MYRAGVEREGLSVGLGWAFHVEGAGRWRLSASLRGLKACPERNGMVPPPCPQPTAGAGNQSPHSF